MTPNNTSIPWSSVYGSGRMNVGTVATHITGQSLWSGELPERSANAIIVTSHGTVVVAADHTLTAIEPGGRILWSQRAEIIQHPHATHTNRIIAYEDDTIVVRDEMSGFVLQTTPVQTLVYPAVTPDGTIVYCDVNDNRPTLHIIDEAGLHTVCMLPTVPTEVPFLTEKAILLVNGGTIYAYSWRGVLQWTADCAGFNQGMADSTDVNTRSIVTPLMQVSTTQVLAGIEWDTGYSFFLFDLAAYTVHQIANHLPITLPLAAPYTAEHGQCFVIAGWPYQDADVTWRSTIALVNLAGRVIWQHPIDPQPHSLVADTAGSIIVAASPSLDQWRKYRTWYHLDDTCFLYGFDSNGNEQFRWKAPGPIAYPLALSGDGHVYTVSEGQVWAIG